MSDKVSPTELTSRQQRAVQALLTARSMQDAAQEAGISSKTLYRWLMLPAFKAALRTAENEATTHITNRLRAGLEKSLDTLEYLIDQGRSEAARRQAAVSWFDIWFKLLELREFDERLTALEERIYRYESRQD